MFESGPKLGSHTAFGSNPLQSVGFLSSLSHPCNLFIEEPTLLSLGSRFWGLLPYGVICHVSLFFVFPVNCSQSYVLTQGFAFALVLVLQDYFINDASFF